eukprot:CAMPEP_0197460714 /NCGR_PEP_ID=MMETSP1175-20131217/54760_1 /TAXON_ID=1003142 /ORGANISM="Triceratium dubium, Strain CCMP147" /LENGTH=204 /DNA_ID=CAMNT_0042995863 /DNA_START=82 /DNA_END=696 /DNA_ORIENTATION=-
MMFKTTVFAVALVAILASAPGANAQVSASELSSIDFESMIGGPLVAVVNAQAQAAMTTVDFVNAVGFHENKTAIMVAFTYDSTNENGTRVNSRLEVPILTMLPIPHLQVDEATIEFNAKISSITKESTQKDTSFGLDVKAGYRGFGFSASLKASYSNKKQVRNSNEEKRDFSLRVFVKATQADMPEGMRRILDILTDSIITSAA